MARETRSKWAKRIARWARSGLDAKTFAEREGVSPETLRWWRWKLGGTTRSEPATQHAAFVEVVPELVADDAARSDDAALELVLGTGVRVVVPAGFDAISLQRLLAILGGR